VVKKIDDLTHYELYKILDSKLNFTIKHFGNKISSHPGGQLVFKKTHDKPVNVLDLLICRILLPLV